MWARLEAHPAWRRYLRFWSEHRVEPEVLALFRLLFFGILAVDMWLQVDQAPRYGVRDFNVSHLPALDSWLPVLTRPVMAFLFVLQAYLAGLVALGGGGRPAIIALTSLFGLTYFTSQLDSFQHHYLMFLLLLLCCLVRWDPAPEPAHGGKGQAKKQEPGAWPVRLILVQMSIVYLFAAVAKMEPRWWDGIVLEAQVSTDWARDLIERMGGFRTASRLVIAVELGLAAAIQVRALRWFAAPIGILFHLVVEASGFKIGLFSYFMIALYVLVLPERPVVRAVQWVRRRAPAVRLVNRFAPLSRAVLRALSIAIGTALVLFVPIGGPARAAGIAVLIAGVAGLYAVGREKRDRHALAHLAACLLVATLACPAMTDVAREYHRLWAGTSRRMGDLATATSALERAVELDPGHAQSHVSLSKLYTMTGKIDPALREAQRAQSLEPDNYRGHLVEAMARDVAGEGELAVAAAERALARDWQASDALEIATRWRARLGMPPPERPKPPVDGRSGGGGRDDDGDDE